MFSKEEIGDLYFAYSNAVKENKKLQRHKPRADDSL